MIIILSILLALALAALIVTILIAGKKIKYIETWSGEVFRERGRMVDKLRFKEGEAEQNKPRVTANELYGLRLHESRDAVNDLIELLKNRGIKVSDE